MFTLAGEAFGSGQAQLTAGAAASVRALGTYLARLGFSGVEVVGHTDSQGNPEANQRLSWQRAEAVRAGLAEAGLGRGKTSARGAGDGEHQLSLGRLCTHRNAQAGGLCAGLQRIQQKAVKL